MTTLALARRQADQVAIEGQLRQALASRALIDQALGVIMAKQHINSKAAFAVLRQLSQNTNRKLLVVAIATIEAATGEPALDARPFLTSVQATRSG